MRRRVPRRCTPAELAQIAEWVAAGRVTRCAPAAAAGTGAMPPAVGMREIAQTLQGRRYVPLDETAPARATSRARRSGERAEPVLEHQARP